MSPERQPINTNNEQLSASPPNELPSYLKQLRKDAGITSENLAEVLGVSRAYVSHWENGKRPINPFQLSDLLSELEVGEEQKNLAFHMLGLEPIEAEYIEELNNTGHGRMYPSKNKDMSKINRKLSKVEMRFEEISKQLQDIKNEILIFNLRQAHSSQYPPKGEAMRSEDV